MGGRATAKRGIQPAAERHLAEARRIDQLAQKHWILHLGQDGGSKVRLRPPSLRRRRAHQDLQQVVLVTQVGLMKPVGEHQRAGIPHVAGPAQDGLHGSQEQCEKIDVERKRG